MKGGTTFYFVTNGIDAALKRDVAGADGKDVRLGGAAFRLFENTLWPGWSMKST